MARNAPKQPIPEFRTMNADLFTLTYGALVMDVIRDREQPEEVNRQLDKIGYNMGLRMADDFLAKNPRIGRCSSMQQLAEVLAKSACKTYLGVQALVTHTTAEEFQLQLESNPLVEFVEIPEEYKNVRYSQVICGIIRGALYAINMDATTTITSDVPAPTIIRVKVIRILKETMPTGED